MRRVEYKWLIGRDDAGLIVVDCDGTNEERIPSYDGTALTPDMSCGQPVLGFIAGGRLAQHVRIEREAAE
jgi:hypothetical protein